MESCVLFYLLSFLSVITAFGMIISANPVYSALFLAGSMIAISGIFFLLEAYFIAGVQLIVYAGAVMVLFVMVLMLFDLKKEIVVFSQGTFSGVLKLISAGAMLGLVVGAAERSTDMIVGLNDEKILNSSGAMTEMKAIAQLLFTRYLFAFEILGVLLLLIAVGVVAVSRIKGGTHARS